MVGDFAATGREVKATGLRCYSTVRNIGDSGCSRFFSLAASEDCAQQRLDASTQDANQVAGLELVLPRYLSGVSHLPLTRHADRDYRFDLRKVTSCLGSRSEPVPERARGARDSGTLML
jgi:hypothetical protein